MALDFAHYKGREQAFVKHTFLYKYLPRLIGKTCSRYDEFVYVDGFAGPWKSAAGEKFDDTSFGIALNAMTAQRLGYLSRDRDVKMRAFLVEKDAAAFQQLQQSIARFPRIEITALHGEMEKHAASIAAAIPPSAFSFTLIDPKGFPEIGAMMPLLKRPNAEALVNFMFDFANRFGDTDLIPKLQAWLSLEGGQGWRNEIKDVSGSQRQQIYEDLAVAALRKTPGYTYSPVITVDKVLQDRPLYKLIFLTRSLVGLEVFRECESQTLGAQAAARSASKAKQRAENSEMGDLFSDGADAVPNDRSSQVIRRSQTQATVCLKEKLIEAGSSGLLWCELWPLILEDFSVTRSWLGRHVNDARKSGLIRIPSWPARNKQIPEDDWRLFWKDSADH